MKKAVVFFADGFEEIEALTCVDVLRRSGMEVTMARIGREPQGLLARGAHDVTVLCDVSAGNLDGAALDIAVLPGGMPGAKNLAESPECAALVRQVWGKGGVVAAICAAPMALHAMNVLTTQRFTCYPGCEAAIGRESTKERVTQDGHLVTGIGPGASLEFALKIVEISQGADAAEKLRKGMIAG